MKTINIKGEDYKVKFGIRAMFIFEQITQKRFTIESTLDTYLLFFSMILASNKDCKLTFDDFIDAMDDDPTLVNTLNNIVDDKPTIDKILDREDGKKKEEESPSA